MLPTEPLPAAFADALDAARPRFCGHVADGGLRRLGALDDGLGGGPGRCRRAARPGGGRRAPDRRARPPWPALALAGARRALFLDGRAPAGGDRGRRRAERLRPAHAGRRRGRRRGDRPGDRARGVAQVAQRSVLRPQAGRRAGRGPRPRTADAVRRDRGRHQRARREVPGRQRGRAARRSRRELGHVPDAGRLAAEVLAAWAQRYQDLLERRFTRVVDRWRVRASGLVGRPVAWSDAAGEHEGTTTGVDPDRRAAGRHRRACGRAGITSRTWSSGSDQIPRPTAAPSRRTSAAATAAT